MNENDNMFYYYYYYLFYFVSAVFNCHFCVLDTLKLLERSCKCFVSPFVLYT